MDERTWPGVELLSFDLAALENIRGQGLQDSFLPQVKSQGFHVPDQPALPVTHRRRGVRPACPRSSENGASL